MKTIAAFLSVILFASSSFAASSSCADLKLELQAMHKAQTQIMNSLVSNHETFASSMEEYSTVVTSPKASVAVVSKEMNNSADSFRKRGVQGQKMAKQLDQATGDLLARVAACL